MRRRKRLLVLAAEVAGAVALVVLIVVVRPFVSGTKKQYSGSTLATYASGLDTPTYVTLAPGEPSRLYAVE
jgi:hypothetical protein